MGVSEPKGRKPKVRVFGFQDRGTQKTKSKKTSFAKLENTYRQKNGVLEPTGFKSQEILKTGANEQAHDFLV